VLLLLASATAAQSAPLAPNPQDSNDSKPSVTAEDVRQLREALAAQQKQIAEQQAKIDALAKQLQAQQRHAPNLGEIASTTPMIPAGTATADASLPANLGQEQKSPAKAPSASDSIVLANGKIKLGAVAYADWGIYPQTGFGPVFLDTPHTYPGPGNDGYNAFNLNRTYINILYSPTDWVTFRITPDIYRDVNSAGGQKLGTTSGVGATSNGSLNFRLKYGYAEFTKIFSGAFKEDNFRAGQQTNPLIDWEEGLYGYRFVSLVPWNFISLSSTYTGVSLNGPIKGSNGKQYLDYQIGVFNNSNFHQYELAETKTVMARASFYPMGTSSKYQGVGLTGFIDYGYNNAAPDTNSQTPVVRAAALVHYQSPHNGGQIAFEYDYGRNAFSTGNLFGGSAPLDLVGLGTTQYAGMSKLASAILAGRSTKQQSFDVFGHINIPNSKVALFGLYQFFQPNTNIPDDPLDFHRLVAGISYRVNKNVRLAIDSQDVLYKHSQFIYPAATLATFNPALAAANPGGIANAVPPSVKALFLNMEFTF
jgi:uncharacterized coiled-coil protein SlyX